MRARAELTLYAALHVASEWAAEGAASAAAHSTMTRPPPPTTSKSYITPDGAKKLRAELDQLWNVERRRVTQEVADAAAQGDRSENAEYIYGKRRLREIDRRVRFLTKRLDAVTIVSESPTDSERVFFGAWVTLEDEAGAEVTYRIVGPDESNVEKGWISMEAPVAKALMGKRDGGKRAWIDA